jgi:uncharacterized protein (TIGR02611 family)
MHSLGTLLRFIWRSSKRAAVFVLGLALLTVGLVMFVTPGPGIVLVVAGLAVLATEFAWAEHLLDKAKQQAARAGQSAQRVPGVSQATAAAGKLVPRRWRRTTATRVLVAESAADGVATGGSISITTASVTEVDQSQPVDDRAPIDATGSDTTPGRTGAAADPS